MNVDDHVAPAVARIPSVDRLLNHLALRELIAEHGRARVRDALRAYLAATRSQLRAGSVAQVEAKAIAKAIAPGLAQSATPSLRPVVNLTGTVLHTNLGRALLPEEAIAAIAQAARAPCNLEFDLDSGERGERDAHSADISGYPTSWPAREPDCRKLEPPIARICATMPKRYRHAPHSS